MQDENNPIALAVGAEGRPVVLLFDPRTYSNLLPEVSDEPTSLPIHQPAESHLAAKIGPMLMTWSESDDSTIADEDTTYRLHCSTHLSECQSFDVVLDTYEYRRLRQTKVAKKTADIVRQYSLHHKLEDKALLKTWGYASRGKGVAICVSAHPTDLAEYRTPASEKSWIVIDRIEHVTSSDQIESLENEARAAEVRRKIWQWVLRFRIQDAGQTSMDRRIIAICAVFDSQNVLSSQTDSHDQLGNIETCEICAANILPRDSHAAYCEAGHSFSKESLTQETP